MSDDLFLQYDAADKGARPLPANSAFWVSPAVVLATTDGNYTVTNPPTQTTIEVQVSLMSPAAFEFINVEVWVCEPTTMAGPSTALAPFQGATRQQLTLTGDLPNPDPSTVHVIQVTGFAPYEGMTSQPGGHCCLIANCYGMTAEGAADGVDLNEVAAANLPNEVQTDPHVAQHNIFADATPPGPQIKVINFPFRAATPLREGAEQVRLEIAETPPAQLRTMLHSGLRELKGAKFAGLRLEVSERPVKSIGLTGLPKEPRHHHPPGTCGRGVADVAELDDQDRRPDREGEDAGRDRGRRGCAVELELEADKSQVLTATVELDPAERPGAAHAFDIVQRDAHGRAQGGFRLVTVARD